MNNLFLEGPIQTGKSTLIREVLREAAAVRIGGFTVQRMRFPTQGEQKRFGFRLMEAGAPVSAHTCVVATDEQLIESDGVFKVVGPSGSRTDMSVFEGKAVHLMQQALEDARAGLIDLILLDEIGGHELACPAFVKKLHELLDSEYPCIGVIKHPASAKRMDPSIVAANRELHHRITGLEGQKGDVLYFERGSETEDEVRRKLFEFVSRYV